MTQTLDGQDAVLKTFDMEQIVGYNNGIQTNEVDVMAKERNLKREYETAKQRGEKLVGIKVNEQIAADFTAKCAENGTNKNAVLKDYIQRYTYENFDQ